MNQVIALAGNAPARLRSFVTLAEMKALALLALPMTGVALVNMGMSITDTVMMGWIGPTALAAGAVVSDLYSIVYYFMVGILSAVSPLIAHALGANRKDDVRRSMRQGFVAAVLLAGPAALAVVHAGDLLAVFGVERAVIDLGSGYALMMALTIIPMMFVAVWRNAFAALGRPRVFLAAIALALPANALANYVLMFGFGPIPAMGLTGAGLASALVAWCLVLGFAGFAAVNKDMRAYRLFQRWWRIDRAGLEEVFRLGLPIGFSSIGEVGVFLISTVIISLFGTEALAAQAITIRMAGVVYAVTVGLSQAATVRVGYAAGQNNDLAIREAVWTAMTAGIVCGIAIFAGLAAVVDILPWMFLDGSSHAAGDVAVYAGGLLFLLGVLNLVQVPGVAATAVLRGFKETRAPMALCLTGYWLIGMPAGYVAAFPMGLGAQGIWMGLVTGVAATAVLMCLRLAHRHGRALWA
ncbi:MAG: MATE family efflux transporter [Rhodospirillales bacterium]|nr:MATE family efflux transporter [Alphaproteobacteria bacterium]MBL6947240.1 MATE family efflux transporter [Rhodospirillales bacterium]